MSWFVTVANDTEDILPLQKGSITADEFYIY